MQNGDWIQMSSQQTMRTCKHLLCYVLCNKGKKKKKIDCCTGEGPFIREGAGHEHCDDHKL